MESIVVRCPAKVNLTLEIVNRREDGFHNIKSIMQLIDLYDYLDIKVEKSNDTEIILSGSSDEIPYDETNLVYKAIKLFLERTSLKSRVMIYIEKNIPIAAGLAGGSTDAAGTLYGLNKIFKEPLSREEIHDLCAKLGSDLNVCLEGGCLLATSRGENVEKIPSIGSKISLIKPKNLGISAKEAYTKYAKKTLKLQNNNTEKMIDALNRGADIKEFLYNDLEYAVFDDYKELQEIKKAFPDSIMSGSGSTYFVLEDVDNTKMSDEFIIINGLQFIDTGVEVV